MSLFQIAEPGESLAKSACKGRVVGIDLGTTNSLVAVIEGGTPRCLVESAEPGSANGEVLLPSVVSYRESGPPLVGTAAQERAISAPFDTIASVKRFMGRGPGDLEKTQPESRFLQYRLAPAEPQSSGVVRFLVTGSASTGLRAITPVEVSAEILRTLRQRAEEQLGGELEGAVITVPAYFDDAQRQATKDAGRLAGLNVLRLLNEPTAAALAYGLDKQKQGKFAVYDLGGGTFDVSILDLRDGIFTVMSTAGDTALGGDDMDQVLAEHLLGKCQANGAGAGLSALEKDPGRARQLLQDARTIKHLLTDTERVVWKIAEQSISVTRSEFESAIAPILARTAAPCRRALKDAELTPEQIDGVVLVGGATRVRAVRRYVAELFGRPPLCDLDPDQVVAQGAAVQADIISQGQDARSDALLIDVTPLSLGLELLGGIVEKIIPRNSRLPTAARQVFTTYADGQSGFDLHVVQGERETVADCRSLARFQLTGIPRMVAGMARLEVTFLVDENGLLQVTARELTSGKEAAISVKPSYGLTDEQVENMLLDSYEHAEEDLRNRLLLEQQVEADRIIAAIDAALKTDGALLDVNERLEIDNARAAVLSSRASQQHRKIADSIAALEKTSQAFAQRRMEKSLNQAIAGKAVSHFDR